MPASLMLVGHIRPHTRRVLGAKTTMRAVRRGGVLARTEARSTDGAATAYLEIYRGPAALAQRSPTPAALRVRPHSCDDRCLGCDQIASDVGPLAPYRVTFTSGATAEVEYCATCAEIARLGAQDPGGSYGAAALPDQIAAIERLGPAGPRDDVDAAG